jgi:signal transduction histidine kinase
VIAYAELLEENEAALALEQRAEFLHRLRGEADRLMSLIEDILDLSRIESGKLTLRRRPLAVNHVVSSALETARGLADKRGVKLELQLGDDLPELSLDEVKMRQVVVNLLVNAIQHSAEHGVVVASTRCDERDVVIEVRDSGAGIDPAETTHIFELFGQGVRERDGSAGGLGIGLHLVKRLSELHGGHVGVNSQPGHGSAFWVRLPLPPAAEEFETEELREAA